MSLSLNNRHFNGTTVARVLSVAKSPTPGSLEEVMRHIPFPRGESGNHFFGEPRASWLRWQFLGAVLTEAGRASETPTLEEYRDMVIINGTAHLVAS